MIGIIISYLALSMSLDLDIFKDNIVSIEKLKYELFGLFITIQLVLFFIKLILNREYGIIMFENIALMTLFTLQLSILYSSMIKGVTELYNINTQLTILIIEVIKAFVMIAYAINNLLDNFYSKEKKKYFQNNFIGVSND